MDRTTKKVKLFSLQELRSSNLQYKLEDGSHSIKSDEKGRGISTIESKTIGGQFDIIACNMVALMWKKFILPNTKVLNISFIDSDSYSERISDSQMNYIRLGTSKSFNHFGSNIVIMSRSKYHGLETDDEKLSYLTTCLYESLLFYCEKFNLDSSPIHEAYDFVMQSDWYSPVKITDKLNSKKTFAARVQTKYGFTKDTYRLTVRNMETDEHYFFPLGKKDPMPIIFKDISQHEFFVEGKEAPPFLYTEEKWSRGNIFTFQWGELEKYEFHLNEMKLRRV